MIIIYIFLQPTNSWNTKLISFGSNTSTWRVSEIRELIESFKGEAA